MDLHIKKKLLVIIITSILITKESSGQEGLDYATLHLNNYQLEQRLRLDYPASRLQTKGNEIWVTGMTQLNVYSPDLTLLKSVPLEGITRAEALVLTETGQLVVANFRGLYLLHSNGSHAQTLKTGGFWDVFLYQRKLFALSWAVPSTIYVFDQNEAGDSWLQEDDVIRLDHRVYRLTVYNETLYVTGDQHLLRYSMTGELLQTYGEFGFDIRGTSRPGLLSLPYLCNLDAHGNALVADYWNYRLQVLDNNDVWSVVSLDRQTEWPRDGLVVEGGNVLWVLEWSNAYNVYYLVKYTAE